MNSGLVQGTNNLDLTGSSTFSQDSIIIDNSSLAAGTLLKLTGNQTHFLNTATLSGTGTTLLTLSPPNTSDSLTVLFNTVSSPLVTSGFGQVTIGLD